MAQLGESGWLVWDGTERGYLKGANDVGSNYVAFSVGDYHDAQLLATEAEADELAAKCNRSEPGSDYSAVVNSPDFSDADKDEMWDAAQYPVREHRTGRVNDFPV